MTEPFRRDPLTGDWVAIVPSRRKVWPFAPAPAELPTLDGRCPFCPGHEADTEETLARVPDAGPWRVRVVANLFPLLDATPRGAGHEVVVEHPSHDADLPDYDAGHLEDVLRVYRDRARAMRGRPGVAAVSLFRNRGRRAGSSQPHPHAQIVAVPVVGGDVARRHALAREHFAREGRTLLSALVARELAVGERVVEDFGRFVAFCPATPRQNHHVILAPRDARGDFADAPDDALGDLARALRATSRRTRVATNGCAYNVVVRMPPTDAAHDPAAAFHVDLLPRRGGGAGFELSTGIDVVTVAPEEAARDLRAASPD